MEPGKLLLWLGFRLIVDQFLCDFRLLWLTTVATVYIKSPGTEARLVVTSKQRNCTLLRTAWFVHCGRNPRTSGPGLAGHLVLPHEPIHPLNVLHIIFFCNIIIKIFIRVYAYIQTQCIHTVKKSTQHSITTYIYQYAFGQKSFSCIIADLKSKF